MEPVICSGYKRGVVMKGTSVDFFLFFFFLFFFCLLRPTQNLEPTRVEDKSFPVCFVITRLCKWTILVKSKIRYGHGHLDASQYDVSSKNGEMRNRMFFGSVPYLGLYW